MPACLGRVRVEGIAPGTMGRWACQWGAAGSSHSCWPTATFREFGGHQLSVGTLIGRPQALSVLDIDKFSNIRSSIWSFPTRMTFFLVLNTKGEIARNVGCSFPHSDRECGTILQHRWQTDKFGYIQTVRDKLNLFKDPYTFITLNKYDRYIVFSTILLDFIK